MVLGYRDAIGQCSMNLISGSTNQTVCVSVPIVPIVYNLSTLVTNVTIAPTIPAGLTFTKDLVNNKCTLSGTPTAATTYNYTITANCFLGSATASGLITVKSLPSKAVAGPNQTDASTCGLTTVTLAANTPAIGTGVWTKTSGTGGTFSNVNSPTSTFTGTAGNAYTLRWTISNAPCTATFDEVAITFNRKPTVANAGPDQTGASTCGLTTVTLAGNVPTVGTGSWTVVSGAGGTFANSNNANTTFSGTPGVTYTLRWTIANAPCASTFDDVVVKFNQTPTSAAAGPDQTGAVTCGLTTINLQGNTPIVGTGLWSIVSGTGGSFSNPNLPNSNFSGSAGNTYTLRWTISNSPCAAATDEVVVTFNRNPTVAAAGPDQTGASTCGLSAVTLAGNSPAIGSGSWSVVSGTGGSFSNANSPTSTFSGVAGNAYTLRWTISSAPCTASFDEVAITFNRNPTTANAGADQTGVSTCGLTTVTLAGNTPAIGTGSWAILTGAGGTFANANSANSTFSGTAGATYTLRWTVANAPCNASFDDIVVKFNQTPTTAAAGPDQTGVVTCGQTTINLQGNTPSAGTGLWSVVSGIGGTFSNSILANSNFTGTAGNTYALRWTISNSPCAASTDEVAVTLNRNPSIAAAGPDQTGATTCGLTSVNLAGNSPAIGTGSWTILNGTGGSFSNASSSTSVFSGTAGNAYTLRWTISNPPCDPKFDEVDITFNAAPVISSVTSSNPTTCTGSNGTIMLSGLQPNTQYLVNFNKNGIPQVQQNISSNISGNLQIGALGKGTYNNLSATLGFCKGISSATVNLVDPTPLAVPTTSQQTTRNECASSFPFNLSVNPVTGQEMNWYKGGVLFVNNQNSISISEAGTYEVEASDPISKCSSASRLKFTVTMKPTPVMPAVSNTFFCAKDNVAFNFVSSPTGATFSWQNDNKKTGLQDTSGTGNLNFVAAANNTAINETSTIKVTPTLNQCNGAEIKYLLTLKPTPQLVSLPVVSKCSGLPLDLADFAISPVISGAQNYAWSNSGVPGLGGNGAGQIPVFTPPANTSGSNITGKITYLVTVSGCVSAPRTFDISIFPQPQLTLTLSENSGITASDGIICENDQISIQSVASNSPAAFQFLWNNGSTSALLLDKPAGPIAGVGSKVYTVTVTDNNGCKNSMSQTISISKYPTANLSIVENSGISTVDGKVCKQDSIVFNVEESNGSSPIYAFAWNANNLNVKSIKIAADSSQNYVVSVTNSGCRTTATKAIEVLPLPTVKINPLITTICSGTSELLRATGGISYKWSPGGQATDTITISPSTPTMYVVTVADANKCVATNSMTVTVLASPRIDSISGKRTILCGDQIDLVCVNSCPSCLYSWSNQQSTKSIQVSSAGKFTVIMTDTVTKCAVSQTAEITGGGDVPKVDSIRSNSAQPICGTGMVELSVKDSLVYDYLWSTGSKSTKIQVGSNANYTVTITSKANPACKKELSWTVNNFKPAVTSTPRVTNSKCETNDGSILLESITGTAGFNFKWGDSSIDTNYRRALKAGDYTLTITDKNGCQEIKSITVGNEGLVPIFSLAADKSGPICDAVTTVTLNTNNCKNCGLYIWNNNTSLSSTAITQNGTYVVTVANASGCAKIDSIIVTNFKTPVTTSATVSNSTCNDPNGTIKISITTGTPNYSFAWKDVMTNTDNRTNLAAGNYFVTITDQNGCTKDSIIFVSNVGEKPNFTITPDITAAICGKDTVLQLTIGNCANCAYLWDNESTANLIKVDANMTYTVTATQGNCSTAKSIAVSNFTTAVTFDLATTAATCNKKNGRITVTPITGILPLTFFWSVGGPSNKPFKDSIAQGSYTITVIDGKGCSKVDYVVVPSDESSLAVDSIYLFQGGSTGLYLYPNDSLCYRWIMEDNKGGTSPANCKNGRNDLAYCELQLNPSETGKIALWVSDCDPMGCKKKVTQVRSEVAVVQPRFVSVFPNPTDGLLNIKIRSEDNLTYRAEIFDLLGRKLRSTDIDKRQTEVVFSWDLQDLNVGTFLFLLTDENGLKTQYKIIVQH